MPDRIIMVGNDRPNISEDFLKKLKAFDPDLCVSWLPTPHRFIIEQCVAHDHSRSGHSRLCRKSYVWMVQDEEKSMMPPDSLYTERKTKEEASMREVARLNSLDNKIQLEKLRTMLG